MKCPYCGQPVADTATVCLNCGGPLTPVVLPEPEIPRIAPNELVVPPIPPAEGSMTLQTGETQRMSGPGIEAADEYPAIHRPPPPSAWAAPPAATQWAAPPQGAGRDWGDSAAAPPPVAAPNRTPLIIGAVVFVAIVVVCLGAGAFFALAGVFTTTRNSFVSPTPVALVFPSITVPTPSQGGDPPRMSLGEFKQLYDNPATRPLIIDVRALETYQAGHITGAISFPESDVDTRIAELPKDKLIIAYCQ